MLFTPQLKLNYTWWTFTEYVLVCHSSIHSLIQVFLSYTLLACPRRSKLGLLVLDAPSSLDLALAFHGRLCLALFHHILSDHRPLITDHHPGWLSQWLICFPGPRVPLRTVHVAICCWCHRLSMTDRIIR